MGILILCTVLGSFSAYKLPGIREQKVSKRANIYLYDCYMSWFWITGCPENRKFRRVLYRISGLDLFITKHYDKNNVRFEGAKNYLF